MKIILQDKWCLVKGATSDEIRKLASTLTFVVNPEETQKPTNIDLELIEIQWERELDYYTFLNKDGSDFRFLSGLLPYFEDHYPAAFEVEDQRTWQRFENVEIPPDYLDGITLRGYQYRAAIKALTFRRGILDIPTRGGKTEVLIAIAKYYLENINPYGKVLFLEPDRKLLHQTFERCKKRGLTDVGRLGDGHNKVDTSVVVCIVDSLYNVLSDLRREGHEALKKATCLLVDEVHHLGSFTMSYIPIVLENLEVMIGVSGSPYNDRTNPHSNPEDAAITGLLHRVILRVSSRYLIDRGYVAEPHVFILGYGGAYPKYFVKSWDKAYNKHILWCSERNQMIRDTAKLLVENNLNVLVLVTRIIHGKHLLSWFQKFSPDALFASGGGKVIQDYDDKELPPDLPEGWSFYSDKKDAKKGIRYIRYPGEQEQIIQDYFDKDTGQGKLLVASQIFDEGVDLPQIDAVIIAGGQGRSDVKNTQRPARALTANDYGNVVFVIDFWDDRHKYTKKHSELRIESYRRNQYYIHTEGVEELKQWVSSIGAKKQQYLEGDK